MDKAEKNMAYQRSDRQENTTNGKPISHNRIFPINPSGCMVKAALKTTPLAGISQLTRASVCNLNKCSINPKLYPTKTVTASRKSKSALIK